MIIIQARKRYTLTIGQRTPATADRAEKQPLHIPFAIELYDNEGNVIPVAKGVTRSMRAGGNVTQAGKTFCSFDNVYFQPVRPYCARVFGAGGWNINGAIGS